MGRPRNMRKKGEAGEAARFISRTRAIRKLQLGLQAFNRVCIVKGIFPIEPKNRIKAQKGDSKYRPLYLKKDIRFLMHDPLITTIRQEEALRKKLAKARHLRDVYKEQLIKRNKPVYRLDQNVLERYPTFIDAVKDLADPLTMIFLFCNIQVRPPIYEHHVSRCQRLKTEFLTYVIEARCLTKAFISTKGYYYEVEIMGHRIVWTAPHNCVTEVTTSLLIRWDEE
ncbi:Pescadillo [Trinorchestia longiramus]|nr:Pescadillo [Trinorchestia longiramus]